jgi:hypothetical protein
MTLRRQKKVASTLKKIVKVELPNASWHRTRLRDGLRRLAAKAQQMGLLPEDVLTDAGRDAFTVIARAIACEITVSLSSLRAEWQMVLRLAEPEFSVADREAFAS